jgi:signal transduction histidine kinase
MRHSWLIWLSFAICLLVVLAAMGWISWTVVRLDRSEVEARRQATLEEKVRLALWRIDTILAPLIGQESTRPYFAYKSFFAIDRPLGNISNERRGGETLVSSPLLTPTSPQILVYFQFEPDGTLSSPQVPLDNNTALAVPRLVTADAVRKAASYLGEVGQLTDREKLLALLPEHAPINFKTVTAPLSPLDQTSAQQQVSRQQREELQQKRGASYVEFEQRSRAVFDSANTMLMNQQIDQSTVDQGAANMLTTELSGVLMTPLWIDGHLILARRITAGGREYVQGCLLNWPAIKSSLLETIADLLPAADLQAVVKTTGQEGSHQLAALPVRLIPGQLSGDDNSTMSPILLSLMVAWACVLAAAAAVAGLLAGIIQLSERRAAFVSAVTHELRTPLTTFQMYAEMLAEDMVPDAQKRREYLNTLHAEAVRLTHLVENVLSYARLERGRINHRLEPIVLEDLLNTVKDRLANRAEHSGMQLCIEMENNGSAQTILANVSAVEQILFNLVDNACKYACASSDKRIHLAIRFIDGAAELSLRDHGPGISASVRRRLFSSFSKSAQEAARSAPGIGLGLALSRRLARDMGGDLVLDEQTTDGARFVLKLPLGESAI